MGKDVKLLMKTGEVIKVHVTGWEGYDDNYVECVEYIDKETGLLCGILDFEVESAEIIDEQNDE